MSTQFIKRSAARCRSLTLLFGIILVASAFYLPAYPRERTIEVPAKTHSPTYYGRLASCRAKMLRLIKPPQVTTDLVYKVDWLCYEEVRDGGSLGDFNIRSTAFALQRSSSRILLWIVVGITLSGVALACLQLLIAYRLASKRGTSADSKAGNKAGDTPEQGTTIDIQWGKISLKSSVTGVVILGMSLAFFTVYIAWVYPLRQLGTLGVSENNSSASQRSTTPIAVDRGLAVPQEVAGDFAGVPYWGVSGGGFKVGTTHSSAGTKATVHHTLAGVPYWGVSGGGFKVGTTHSSAGIKATVHHTP